MHPGPHILHLEDSATDAEIIEDHLQGEDNPYVIRRVQTREDFLDALTEFKPALVLADYNLPHFDGLSALRIIKKVSPAVPVIIVTGAMSDVAVAELLVEGAEDYVIKDRLARLGGAVRLALSRTQGRERIQRLSELRQVLSDVNHVIAHATTDDFLFKSVCDIVIRDTSLQLAWIGLVDPATSKISHRFSSGTSIGLTFMAEVSTCLASVVPDCTPATSAAKERQIVIVENAQGNDDQALSVASRKISIGSQAAVPLFKSGDVYGVLAVAAGPAGFFDEEISRLLEEMGQEISFCLDTLVDKEQRQRAEQHLRESISKLKRAMIGTVNVISAIVEARDPYTYGHEHRVGEIAAAIGKEMGLNAGRIEGLRIAGYLHDVGKISTPSEYLSKPGKLTAPEFDVIKDHAEQGYQILKGVEFDGPIALVARQHHERMDGSGYPQGLKNGEIILEARIVAVADTVEAMSSNRPYRPGFGIDAGLTEISAGAGTRYDPDVAAACLRLFQEKDYKMPD
jgi:putative nucleotidyltransferase with HDIG domain